MTYVLGAIFGLGLLIVVHEAGHFVVARLCGMRVERFSIGFGPGILKWKSKKGTIFQLAPVPFGGFVEIKGMNIAEDVDPDDKAAYPNRPVWQRIATIFAGPGTNYLTAVVLAFLLYSCAGVSGISPRYVVGAVDADYPAAGKLHRGDKIIAVNGQEIWFHGDHPPSKALATITDEAKGKDLNVTIERDGKRMDVAVGTKFDDREGVKRYRLGIAFEDRTPVGVFTALGYAVKYPWDQTKQILGGLYRIATQKEKADVGGAIRIGEELTRAFKAGFVIAIELMMLLNVYLGLFNLLPLPALDGGRLAFLGYELATRRRPNPKVETTVHMIGILILIPVLILVGIKDCRRLF